MHPWTLKRSFNHNFHSLKKTRKSPEKVCKKISIVIQLLKANLFVRNSIFFGIYKEVVLIFFYLSLKMSVKRNFIEQNTNIFVEHNIVHSYLHKLAIQIIGNISLHCISSFATVGVIRFRRCFGNNWSELVFHKPFYQSSKSIVKFQIIEHSEFLSFNLKFLPDFNCFTGRGIERVIEILPWYSEVFH